jgi:hypothetical protein
MNSHIEDAVLVRYATGDGVAADALWALEAHLESCAPCRARLGSVVRQAGSPTAALLERVQRDLDAQVARSPQMPRRVWPQRLARWSPPGLLPRLTMSLVVLAAALGLDLIGSSLPSLVLLVAPVAPLLGVAAVWSARLDPEHELVVASPRAGLYLVLRRTLAVLVVVMPALGAAGWIVGASPARWLVPCLAFTAGALALGELIGLRLAAGVLTLAWVAGVITPSVVTARTPLLLDSSSLPYWSGLFVVIAIALAVRRDAYTGWRSGRWFAL